MKVKRVCLQCGKEFYVHECYIKRGGGKFCCVGYGTRYRNLHNNPSWNPENRAKISANHANVSGKNNPMYGRRGKYSPSHIDGRNSFVGEVYRKKLLATGIEPKCVVCGSTENLHVHHKDGNHENNDINNLVWVCCKCHNNVIHQRKRNELGQFTSEKSIIKEVA